MDTYNQDYLVGKAIEILSKLSPKDIEKYYGSHAKDCGELSITKERKFLFKQEKSINITDNYARQVFYRYTLRNVNNLLNSYIQENEDFTQTRKAELYINIYKNIELVYNNKRDDDDFDKAIKKITCLIVNSLELEKSRVSYSQVGIIYGQDYSKITYIKPLTIKKQVEFKNLEEFIQKYTLSKKR